MTAGINRKKVEYSTNALEGKQMEYSVAYAATKELSIGLNYSKAERNAVVASATGIADEKVKSIAIGYNMGPVVLVGQYGQVEAMSGTAAAANDGDVLYLQLSTKF
jgi:hypothetical protein